MRVSNSDIDTETAPTRETINSCVDAMRHDLVALESDVLKLIIVQEMRLNETP